MIPKIIHYCWLSKDAYPELVEKCLASWKKNLPDYKFVLWDTDTFDVNSIKWTKEAFELKKYAFVADYIRLYALYNCGGIYLDTDVEVFKNFDDVINTHSFMGWECSGDIEAAVIGAEKNTEWIGRAMSYYEQNSFIKSDKSLSTTPMPIVLLQELKSIIQLQLLEQSKREIVEINSIGLKLYPCCYFSPKNSYTNALNRIDKTYCAHHFNAQWVKKDLKYHSKKVVHGVLTGLVGQDGHDRIVKRIRKIKKQ